MNPKTTTPQMIPHANDSDSKTGTRLNWLRASVMGANDGIVSIAALVMGVAGASDSSAYIMTAGVAGLVAGALSMSLGEYVSVSAQRDSQQSLLDKERRELTEMPQQELDELAHIYEKKGLTRETALRVALELTDRDALAAHAEAELHIDPTDLTNPWHAALASGTSFVLGGVIPLVAIALPTPGARILVAFVAVLCALVITGSVSAYAGGANKFRAIARVVGGGFLAMLITYMIGSYFGVRGI